jgi:hypothetical protein
MRLIDRIMAIEELLLQLVDRGNEVTTQGPANKVRKASLSISGDKAGEATTSFQIEFSVDISQAQVRRIAQCIVAVLNEYFAEQGGAQ